MVLSLRNRVTQQSNLSRRTSFSNEGPPPSSSSSSASPILGNMSRSAGAGALAAKAQSVAERQAALDEASAATSLAAQISTLQSLAANPPQAASAPYIPPSYESVNGSSSGLVTLGKGWAPRLQGTTRYIPSNNNQFQLTQYPTGVFYGTGSTFNPGSSWTP